MVVATPHSRSEWPPRCFVADCTETSAPTARGCWASGPASVLSTARIEPDRRAVAAMRRRSMTSSIGFEGDSIQIRSAVRAASHRVVGRRRGKAGRGPPTRALAGCDQPCDALVTVLRPDDVPADRNQLDHRSDRRHPRRECHGITVLESADDALERRPCRCAVVTRVVTLPAEDEVRGRVHAFVQGSTGAVGPSCRHRQRA